MKYDFISRVLLQKEEINFLSNYNVSESILRLRPKRRLFPELSLRRSHRVKGTVNEQKVILCRVASSNFQPIFYGHWEIVDGHVSLKGYFTVKILPCIYIGIWFGFVLIMGSFSVISGGILGNVSPSPGITRMESRWLTVLGPLAMLLFGIALIKFDLWLSRNDKKIISDFIRAALQDDVNK